MKKICIFGSGYVGTYLKNACESPYQVAIYNKKDHSYDLPDRLIEIISDTNPDYVVNCCGYTGKPNVDACETDKTTCWRLNVDLPVTMATVCKTMDIPFLHVSSGCIYSGYKTIYNEASRPDFGMYNEQSSWYSKTKHASEIAIQNLNSYIFRIRMPFCADNHERNFLNKVLKYNNLIDYKNSMTCIEDFVKFIYKFLAKLDSDTKLPPIHRKISPGIYNVCNPGSISIKDVVKLFEQHGKINADWNFVKIDQLNLKANRSNCILDCNKIKNIGLQLPPAAESLQTCVKNLCHPNNLTINQ